MRFKLRKSVIFLCVMIISQIPLATANTAVPVTVKSFQLVPLACVAKVIGEPCKMVSQLTWQLNQAANVCFWQNQQKVKCWNNTKQVQESIQLALEKESNFRLVLMDSERLLTQQRVKINYLETKYRRKLRSKWSIF